MNVEEAKDVLRKAGYYVDNLWSIHDVDPEGNDITDEEKYKILDTVIDNDWLKSEINHAIQNEVDYFCNLKN
jgi:hypothetical protein